jgi:hypothetical protein
MPTKTRTAYASTPPADVDKMREMSGIVLRILTHPDFLEQVKAVKDTPPDRRLQEASRRLTPEALRKIAIDLPENVRLSSRYFDDQINGEVMFADSVAGTQISDVLRTTHPGLVDKLQVLDPGLLEALNSRAQDLASSGGCICGGFAGGCIGGGWS